MVVTLSTPRVDGTGQRCCDMAPALERLSACFGADISADRSALLAPVRQLPLIARVDRQHDCVMNTEFDPMRLQQPHGGPTSADTSSYARQGASSEYDAATAAVSAARQALDDAADGERAAFVAAGADAKLARRICVEDTEEGIVLRVRGPRLHCQRVRFADD